jgi:hypothetical protein
VKLDLRSRHRNRGRPPQKDAPGFLQFVRGRPCIFADSGDCQGKVQACHLDFAGGKGLNSKVADRYSVPMCGLGHHARQHGVGWDSFMAEMGVTREELMIAAARLWHAWPSRRQWESKQQGDAA